MLVWLNGKLVDRESASIPIHDAGFQHGIGLFETMAARHGRAFRAAEHVERLVGSARELLLTDRLQPGPLAEAVQMTLERNGLQSARVRLTVTGGNLGAARPGGVPARRLIDPTILIDAQPPTAYPEAFFERGVAVTIADGRANPHCPTAGHKTLAYWPRILALQVAATRKAGEALWLTTSDHLAGGSVSNAFLVGGGALLTPPARGEDGPSAVRPGVTRAAVLELARALGIEAVARPLTLEDLEAADEVFLTNASWGVLPVVAAEGRTIGTGEVGRLTRRLREAWLELVERETAGGDGGAARRAAPARS